MWELTVAAAALVEPATWSLHSAAPSPIAHDPPVSLMTRLPVSPSRLRRRTQPCVLALVVLHTWKRGNPAMSSISTVTARRVGSGKVQSVLASLWKALNDRLLHASMPPLPPLM